MQPWVVAGARLSWLAGAAFLAAVFGSIAHQILVPPLEPERVRPSPFRRQWCIAELDGLADELDGQYLAVAHSGLGGRAVDSQAAWLGRWQARQRASQRTCARLGDVNLNAGMQELEGLGRLLESLGLGGDGSWRQLRRQVRGRVEALRGWRAPLA